MAHSFSALYLHIIFSTKHRDPLLTPDLRPRHFPYMAGIVRELGATSLITNGPADHVHMLTTLTTTRTVADFIRDIKANASSWVKENFPQPTFAWQTGYAAFSVSKSGVDTVHQYITTQEAHHKTTTFQEEYLAFLKRHEIPHDPRFVFD